MALCNADTLLSQACDSKFLQLAQSDPKMAMAVLLQLLCNLSASGGSAAWGSITGTLTNQTDLVAALNAVKNKSGNGSPVGVVTPDYVGQTYADLFTPGFYFSNGLTINSWFQIA